MIEVLEFVFSSFWRFLGCTFIGVIFAWWSVVIVASFKPVIVSMSHVYNGMLPEDMPESEEGTYE